MNEETKRPSQAKIAADWWRDLQDLTPSGARNPKADRAARARLRRATPQTAFTDEAVQVLYRRLWGHGFRKWRMDATIRVALVLAQLRADETEWVRGHLRLFGEAIGRAAIGDPDSAPLKPLRFRRLLQADEEEDIIRQFRRALDIAGNKANVEDLARLLLGWAAEGWKDEIRAGLAFAYFGAEPPRKPAAEPAPETV